MPAPGRTELIDRVDGSNAPVGVVQRKDVLDVGANFRTVHVLLFDAMGTAMLQRVATSRRRHPGRLGSSVAGYLHRGESFEEAAARRTREELGIRPSLDDLGTVEVQDERSTKFVGVFVGASQDAAIQDPDHVDALVHFDGSEVDRLLRSNPELFTPTLAVVWRFARDRIR